MNRKASIYGSYVVESSKKSEPEIFELEKIRLPVCKWLILRNCKPEIFSPYGGINPLPVQTGEGISREPVGT